ncbi:MAG: Hsp20/alpha crystallin family protein [Treponemataceae bacterium]|nr:Hsp20/alpha crystallin family protein [Spirochaetales bacterium]MDY6031143.1 Hsp20/alpha crystallin family protein [Treponemataceae bacterium]
MNTLSFFNPRFTSDLFDVIDRNFSDMDNFGCRTYAPKVDVQATKESYELEMELPGLTEKDVTIDLKDREITIASVDDAKEEKKEAKEEVKATYLVKERVASHFSRSFTLPDDIDPEGVNAKFQNGLLTITIPRKAESKARRIAISA